MLRRLKEDVEKTLQPKEETIIEVLFHHVSRQAIDSLVQVQLSNIQKKYYRAILERNFTHLLKGTSAPNLMNAMMELRKCCNHPFLINGAEEQIISELRPLNHGKSEEELQQISLVQSSGKLVLIDKLLPKLRQDGHKVLIFSQMVKVLDLLEEFLIHHKYVEGKQRSLSANSLATCSSELTATSAVTSAKRPSIDSASRTRSASCSCCALVPEGSAST